MLLIGEKIRRIPFMGNQLTSNHQLTEDEIFLEGFDFDLVFIDWITIREEHTGQFTELNDGCVIKYDRDGGIIYTSELTMPVVGSYDSSLRIRITSQILEISYNPSKWHRPDNLYGLTFDQVLIQINNILHKLDQPNITIGKRVAMPTQQNGLQKYAYTGAQVTRIDVTINLKTGSEFNLADYEHALMRVTKPRYKNSRKKNTLYWGAGSNKTIKYYPKHVELVTTRNLKRARDPEYIKRLSLHCRTNGLARIEVKYGRHALRALHLRATGDITHAKLVEQFSKDILPMLKPFPKIDTRILTNTELGIWYQHQQGVDLKSKMSSSAFSRWQKRFLDKFGYDISEPVSELDQTIEQQQKDYSHIKLEAAKPPSWYKMPEEINEDQHELKFPR